MTPDFFAAHTVSDLMRWSDFALEDVGRLTEPMRYDPAVTNICPSIGTKLLRWLAAIFKNFKVRMAQLSIRRAV